MNPGDEDDESSPLPSEAAAGLIGAMTVLPIVGRELRVAARRPFTHWSRAIVGLFVLIICTWVLLVLRFQAVHQQSKVLFGVLTGGALLIGGLSGVRATADCISEEKREGTLGLLFLTPLRGYDVVLGKLAASSLLTLYGIVAVVPLLALPLLMGGVKYTEFVRMALLLVNAMAFSLTIGMAVSAISKNAHRARFATLIILLVFSGLLPLLGAMIAAEFNQRDVQPVFLMASPAFTFVCAYESTYVRGSLPYWASMATLHALSWGFLLLACYRTPRVWQDRVKARVAPLAGVPVRGADEDRTRFRRLLDKNAFYWLAARPRHKPLIVWGGLAALGLLWLGFGLKYGDMMVEASMLVVVALLVSGLLKFGLGFEATRQLARERKSGSIELLLSTPITVREIITGQGRALWRQFGWQSVVLIWGALLMMVFGAREWRTEDQLAWIACWLAGIVVFILDMGALYIVGLWMGLKSRTATQAATGTQFRILALPWILYCAMLALMALADEFGMLPRSRIPEWMFFIGSWFLIAVAVDALMVVWAWRGLVTRFRETAASRYQVRSGFWRRLFGAKTPGGD